MITSRMRGGCSACCQGPHRLYSNTSMYDVLPLEVEDLIDDLFDTLEIYERALSRQQPNFRRLQQQPQRSPRQQQQFKPNKGYQPQQQQRKSVSTGRQQPKFQQNFPQQQKFQGKPQLQQWQKQTTNKMSQQQPQFQQKQPSTLINKSNKMQQKYRICVDCRCCDCDPSKIQKSLKCGANGLYHLTVFAPCKSNPAKTFKRSYTLPSQVQHNKLQQSVTPQGHCLFEFPLMEEPSALCITELMQPVQRIKTADGQTAFFVQVPILPIVDPAKVKVCIKDGALLVKFEHKKTIGDICSRVFFCDEIPLPKCNNIDFSSIVCKQNKHTLNITVPIKQQQQQGTTKTLTAFKEIPVHRKLRHGSSAMMTQQKRQSEGSCGSNIIQKQTKPVAPKPKSTGGGNEPKKTMSDIKKNLQKPQLNKDKPSYPKLSEAVSKGSELLEQVFGFGGGKSSSLSTPEKQTKKSTNVKQTSQDKGRNISSDVNREFGEPSGGSKSPERNIQGEESSDLPRNVIQ